ncbi:MAG: SCO family protein [Actinomycetota bacterium]|nr:SCO family protein [Actinomycetota bacterium]
MLATRTLQRLLLVALVSLLAAIGVVLVTNRAPASPTPAPGNAEFKGPTLPAGLRASDFSLADQNGRRVSLSGYRGRVVILTFIHSLCHDTCPFMVEQIKGALNDLPQDGRSVPAIGISVAPGEDTVANRRKFLAKHEISNRMAFLSGPLASMRRVWHAYAMQPVQGPIDHSTFVLLIDKRGFERIGFPAEALTPEGLVHDIRVLEREPA